MSNANNKEKILVVEDDKGLASFLAALLSHHEYEAIHAENGKKAVQMAASYVPDLILLDLGLPDMDGHRVLGQVREWSDVPVIIISARQTEQEKVKALDGGANDYVTKPFGIDELLARIRAAIRIHRQAGGARMESVFSNGGLRVDYEKRAVTAQGDAVHLTPTEYRLLTLLARHAGKVLTHEFILTSLWGPHAGESQTLRVNVANLRRKIEKDPAAPRYILTEIGVGYRMPVTAPNNDSMSLA